MKKYLLLLTAICILSSCTQIYRSIAYWTPDIDEYSAFPQDTIECGDSKYGFYFPEETNPGNVFLTLTSKTDTSKFTLDEYLSKTSTTAFLIIRNDTVIFEKYYQGYNRSDISTLFSVTKSVTSLLIGIAVDEGYIESTNDPVTKYLPELDNYDPNFRNLTIEHLLNFQAGFDFNESYINPFSGMARLYYGNNQLKYLKKLKFIDNPGEVSDYNSATTAFLGLILERATQKSYAEYLEVKVWKPLGMEYNALVSLDGKKHRSAKAYAGLNATAIDLAKIGRLYLKEGSWNGNRIISKDWIVKSKTPNVEKEHIGYKYKGQQYQWYSKHYMIYDSLGNYKFADTADAFRYANYLNLDYYKVWKYNNKDGSVYYTLYAYYPDFYALGIMNQILYIDPESNLIMVRLGKDWDKNSDIGYTHLMHILAKRLKI